VPIGVRLATTCWGITMAPSCVTFYTIAAPGAAPDGDRRGQEVDIVKIAITGGAGFLGYHLARGLGGEHELTLLDIAPFDPTDYPTGVRCHHVDVSDEDALCHLLAGQAVVIAAAAALPLCKRRDIRAITVRGPLNVLTAVRQNG